MINKAWLADAELMIVQMQWIGRSSTEMEIKEFRLGN
jgi:hypothetical protein